MTRAEMLARLRKRLNVTGTDVTWTDDELISFLTEGQDVFCEETGYFVDATTHTLTMVEGQAIYDIPDRIISVYDVYYGTSKLEHVVSPWVMPNTLVDAVPLMWEADSEGGVLKFAPAPSADYAGETLTLRTWRYSVYSLDNDDIDGEGAPAVPELPSTLQPACIEWAAYKAYDDHDIDAQDPVKAADHLKNFQDYVRRGRLALKRKLSIQDVQVGGNMQYVVSG